jgi:hypothetical protein
MTSSFINTPQALDAAIAAGREARREKLLRTVRNQRIRIRVVLAMSGCVAIGALAAFFLADDREAAAVIAMMAFVSAIFAIISGQAARKKVLESSRPTDQAR